MVTPTEPATSPLFRALRSVDVDPELAYEAAEETRRQAGDNVVAAIEAKIDSQSAHLDRRFSQIETKITDLNAEIKAQRARIDDLRQVVWRVIWPLIVLLAVPVFSLLYKALTS